MKRQESEALGILAGVGAIVVASGIMYRAQQRKEQRKRAKIKEWETNCIEAINAAKNRVMRMADDPNVTSTELLIAWNEEMKFIKLIESQPMY